MASKCLYSGVYENNALDDGFVEVDRAGARLHMNRRTFQTLHLVGATSRVFPSLRARGDGLHLIPPALLRPDVADEVRRGLQLVGAQRSEHCLYPPCILPAVTVVDGFVVCREHAETLRGWDDVA